MRHRNLRVRPASAAAVLLAAAFEVFLVVCTQLKPVMRVTPWQDDPYHGWISLAVFALPMLLVVVALRAAGPWLPWGRSSTTGRQRDLAKAGLVLTSLVAITALDCWLAVGLGEHHAAWDRRTTWLGVALGVMTAAVPLVAWRCLRDLRTLPRETDADWVGDVLPASVATWVRRHDRAVFLAASVVAATAIIGALVVGERWTDPLLIGWALAVEITCYYAFCVVTNAVLGFVERPVRDRRTERAVVIGSLAFQVSVAFHGQLEPLLGIGSPDGVPRLVEVTAGPAVLVFALALAVVWLRPVREPARPAR